MDILIMIAQLILSLSILVILHELGHFIPAKLFKTRVEKFYLFFDPWFSLFKFKKGDTEYGIGWLPLGGYVKISGMVDESMDKEFTKRPPQPWEFRSKKAWQRLIIMIGGVTVNFILGFLIFGLLLYFYGEKKLSIKEMKYGIATTQLAKDMGLQDGDKIVKIGDRTLDYFNGAEVAKDVLLNDVRNIEVERNGKITEVTIPEAGVEKLKSNQSEAAGMIAPRFPTIVFNIDPASNGAKAGLQKGDQIISINGAAAPFFSDLSPQLKENKGKKVDIGIIRNGDSMTINQLQLSEQGQIGFNPAPLSEFFKLDTVKYSLFKAMPTGFKNGYDFISTQISAFGQMFTGKIKPSESLGGFASITKLFPSQWDTERFWNITAILSLILGFMNLLPIPALDGGYIMFLLWEVVTGKKVNDKVMEVATTIGMILLLGLLLYANGLDVIRAFK
ncbi:MAG: RIP metalloprotease RseP [Saprospiraceae bacterium]|jgi:regulator of sigma E protease|nr:RIP metalloprotease RseP [Saprospiraceae bacterium]HMT76770.1 RIP metalloprotease RseP [Saprospiraceae bacterium]HQW94398.1 RIP metalloprotease RseP [Saprospiraceae bacterium]